MNVLIDEYVSSDTIFIYYYDFNVHGCAYMERCKLIAKILPLHPDMSYSKLYLITSVFSYIWHFLINSYIVLVTNFTPIFCTHYSDWVNSDIYPVNLNTIHRVILV